MNIQEAKSIRLVDFLAGLGHHPVIQRGNSVWYKSPFRMERRHPSKLTFGKNCGMTSVWGRAGILLPWLKRFTGQVI